ncbi:MAG: DUF61 family protein [Candidatus Heimdallarchaeota archaeon]|nr:DUF61 family protein [Candidatus Heimdallarchaeota archaeon]MDH5646255.1 DUF61 family protein [Candidatus Heimdallarchaeota archaeon]
MDDKLSKHLQWEIDKINLHLPKSVVSLKNILNIEKPKIQLRDGDFIEFDTQEVEAIKEIIPEKYWGQVLLPIIITRRRDLGSSAFSVGGSDPNFYIILSLFEELKDYTIWKLDNQLTNIFYRPQIKKIRKVFPTTTVIAFT